MDSTHFERAPGMSLSRQSCGAWDEWTLTATPRNGERPAALLERVVMAVTSAGFDPMGVFVFGDCAAWKPLEHRLAEVGVGTEFPMLWTDGRGVDGNPIAGVQVFGVSGASVSPVYLDAALVGTVARVPGGQVCFLAGVESPQPDDTREQQAAYVFDALHRALDSVGMSIHDVGRTWLYVDRILDWYGSFNTVRTAFFDKHDLFSGLVPASTGIGSANPAGAAVSAAAIAWSRPRTHAQVSDVMSPLQCSARDYGSSFSRAIEVMTPNSRRILVSGTASIAPEGQTVHLDDIDGQIDLTMKVIEAILGEKGMTFSQTVRAIVYVKEPSFADAWSRYAETHGLADLPAVVTHTDICRDDLLFEVELDAVSPVPG